MLAHNTAITIAILASAAVAMHIALPWFLRNLLAKRSVKKRLESEKVYLTFDDGPDPNSTPRILDILAKHNASATFFVIGEAAKRHPEIIKRIRDEGHALGSHSFRHTHAWKTNPISSFSDFHDGICSISETSIWRPPYGKANLLTLLYGLVKNIDLIYWTNDPRDYDSALDSETLSLRLIQTVKLGDVVLLHDGRRTRTHSQNITPDALESFLEQTKIPESQFDAL